MFFLFLSGASAWTVGVPAAPVQYASPVDYEAFAGSSAAAGFLASRAGVPTMIVEP